MEKLDDNLNLKFIFVSLVSGQVDADRMDYLLRDSRFSGMSYGQFDLEKVIEGLAVSVEHTGNYREVVIDCVEYENITNGKIAKECQMEIELKSFCQNRINMKRLTDKIEKKLNCLTAVEESKYQRALKMTE